MKPILCVFALLVAAVARGQIPVTDAASIANNRIIQAENLSKWVDSISHLQQQIDALNRQINITSDIRRWGGDPKAAGANLILEGLGGPDLVHEYGRAQRAVVGVVDSLYSLKRTANGTFDAIGSADLDGNEMKRDPMIYRRYAVLDAKQDLSAQVTAETGQREQQLQSEIAATLEDLKAADTDAEVQKQSAKLSALNGQLAQVEAARRREVDGVMLQKIANDSRSEEEQRAEAELEARNDYLANQRISAFMKTVKVRQNNDPTD
ncbi:hypothetical protein DB347_25065 [Opitutaceae bacterium EW11]|nr:hypothetical protein DB347_25065 [Opitutaceae bacterium EW11]